jgi:hypothetical protein
MNENDFLKVNWAGTKNRKQRGNKNSGKVAKESLLD